MMVRKLLLCTFLVILGLICVHGETSPEAEVRLQNPPRVWVYSLVATDYDGDKLLEHFLRHYRSLGISDAQFHLDLLHDPEEPNDGLKRAIQILTSQGIDYSVIEHNYVPSLQDIEMMKTLHRLSIPPEDWIIVADTDEFFTYQFPTVHEAAIAMEKEGATYAMGEMLDHMARNGTFPHMQAEPSLWDQYPLVCPIISEVAKGLPAKVTIHKGFLRSGAGHHHIVDPTLAKAYFGAKCSGPSCELVMKMYKQRSTVDLFSQTPYFRYSSRFSMNRHKSRSNLETHEPIRWECKEWSVWTKVHHFKWHGGLVENLRHRAQRDSGDCILDVNEDSCHPNFQFWKEVSRQYAAVSKGVLNTTAIGCKEGVDTLWTW